jgi:hypothetical protein
MTGPREGGAKGIREEEEEEATPPLPRGVGPRRAVVAGAAVKTDRRGRMRCVPATFLFGRPNIVRLM